MGADRGRLVPMIRYLLHALLTLTSAAGLTYACAWSVRAYPEFSDATDVRVFRCALNPLGDPWCVTAVHWHELTPGGFDGFRKDERGRITSRRYELNSDTRAPETMP
jgi:hypothetical protein